MVLLNTSSGSVLHYITKARLVVHGFEEEWFTEPRDSPICNEDSLRKAYMVMTAFGWICNSIDIRAAFLQGDKIYRDVFVLPPKEFFLWKNKEIKQDCL